MYKFIVYCIVVILLLGIIVYPLVYVYKYKRDYDYALLLADDSSLPRQKADYLKQYIEKVSTIKGKARYIFMTPNLELDKQIIILKGLVERFEELDKLNASSMAYQQGMYQLTGQEMENVLRRISNIFYNAKLRENPINYVFMMWTLPTAVVESD
jgi:hypothetical protein